jgi:ribosome-associated translation inhibitor RaiA
MGGGNMQKPIENKLSTVVGHSGNSDVDLEVNIDIDTKAIAYGMLCSLYAKGDLSDVELEKAIQKLDSLIERDKRKRKSNNNINIENKPKLFDFPPKNTRRNWF